MAPATIQTAARIGPSSPVSSLRGVAGRVAEKLARLDIHSVQDLLLHLPLRYQDRSRRAPIDALRPGDEARIEAEVEVSEARPGRRRMLLVHVCDGTGVLALRFFNFSARQRQLYARGTRLSCYGEIRASPGGLEMVHPEVRLLPIDGEADEAPALTAVYPATAGLHQATLRAIIGRALDLLGGDGPADDGFLAELLPGELVRRLGFPGLKAALRFIHRPPVDAPVETLALGLHPARRRLAFEELLAHQLGLRSLRAGVSGHRAPPMRSAGGLQRRFLDALPFELTGAQRRVLDEIARDLARPRPMQRLLQGDVGSGKTAVAAASVLIAVEAGHQAAIMAPTELLAEQHFRTIGAWLEPLGVELRWLSGKTRSAARAGVLEDIRGGGATVVVGTHALVQAEVAFASLGLVVIDEQHRFGVHQRLALREKGRSSGRYPHQLIMTATPIPRTLTMTAYADLDCSVIDELPPGREPVTTVVIPDTRRDDVLARVREVCRAGRQAYWVCTLIEESEALQCEAASDTAERLSLALPELGVGLLHGRLKPAEKEGVMAAFASGAIHLLVATTVVEVGVDVPNATLMIIENAERLGLAQLHQLRGRVGRGGGKSACVLMYHSPLSDRGRARLGVLRETTDGFDIAQRDLELRGPGEILGVRQAGQMRLRTADLLRDRDLVPVAADTAAAMLRDDRARATALMRRWLEDGPQYRAV